MADTTSTVKPTTSVQAKKSSNAISLLAPVLCVLAGYLIWRFVLGNPDNFKTAGGGWFWPDRGEPKTALSKIECPIYAEIDAVFKNNKGHIMMIDDARLFIGKHDYPTIEELTAHIKKIDTNYSVTVQQDIIRVVHL